MPKYHVAGDYGPLGGQSICIDIDADNPSHAKNLFCEQVALEYPSEWERMGRHNVSVVYEIKPKAEPEAPPKAVEIVQTMWRVKFRSRSDMIVTAATLLDVADHVRGWCEDNRFPVSDVTRIEYLAY